MLMCICKGPEKVLVQILRPVHRLYTGKGMHVCTRGELGEADVVACVNLAACLMLTHADHRRLIHKSFSGLFINVST